jgi:hypothetical protein
MQLPLIEPPGLPAKKMVGLMSFSLWTVFAKQSRKTPGPGNRGQERMHPQSTDELSAPVALLQSRILSAVRPDYSTAPVQPSPEQNLSLVLIHTNKMI